MVSKELRKSNAYRVLTPQGKNLLMEWLSHYGSHSHGDTKRLPVGIMFTWSACEIDIHEDTFSRVRKRLLEVGFLHYDPMDQTRRPAAPNHYKPSTEWRNYKPTKLEQKRMDEVDAKKKRRILKKNRRRTDFRSGLGKGSK